MVPTFRSARPLAEPPAAAWESEEWFLSMPAEERARYVREHRAKHERFLASVQRERKQPWIDCIPAAILFVIADLATRSSDVGSLLLMVFLGATVGFTSSRFALNEVVTGAGALAVFFLAEWVVHGGLSGMHLFVCFPLGFTAAWITWRRADRGL